MKILKTEILKPLNKKKPKEIIILFHGYGGNGKSISLLANFWPIDFSSQRVGNFPKLLKSHDTLSCF